MRFRALVGVAIEVTVIRVTQSRVVGFSLGI